MVLRIDKETATTTTSRYRHYWISLPVLTWLVPLIAILLLVGSQLRTSLSYFPTHVSEYKYAAFFTDPNSAPVLANKRNDRNEEEEEDDEDKPYNDNDDGPPTPLNIVIFYPDDWRYDAIGDAQPEGVVHTPFLTQLAKEGIRFTHNAVTTSVCWISRATLFTGRYVSQHRSERLYCPIFTMPQNWNHTWPAMLRTAGNYFVGHVGKWQFHNPNPAALFDWSSFHEGHHWYTKRGKKIHAADMARDDAIRFLRERPPTQNFALTVAFYPPKPLGLTPQLGSQWQPDEAHAALYDNQTFHQPYNYSEAFSVLPPFLKRGYTYDRWNTRWKTSEQYQASMKHYYALVSHIDDACRDVVAELDRQGVLNTTLLLISADNGLFLGAHAMGGKWHPYQESIRVPLIVWDPRMARSKHGTTNDAYTLNVDLAPTVVAAAGLAVDPRMQGRDLADLYVKKKKKKKTDDGDTTDTKPKPFFETDVTPWREDFYYEFPLPEFPASTALVTRRYKYIRWNRMNGKEQLFDLQNDPFELNDMLSSQKAPTQLLMESSKEQEHAPDPETIQKIRGQLKERHDELERRIQEPLSPGEVQIPCVAKGGPGATLPWP
jgi:arylsulfatase